MLLIFSLFILLSLPSTTQEENSSQQKESHENFHLKDLETPEACVFLPPEGWQPAPRESLPGIVKAMVIGKGGGHYPPSINLGIEPYEGTLKGYIKQMKGVNERDHSEFKDLGQVSTLSGNASLVQVDMQTEWGVVRLLHATVVRYGNAYVLTAASLKEEFSIHYKHFFQAIRSLKINKDIFEMIPSPEKRSKLQGKFSSLKNEASEVMDKSSLISDLDLFLETHFKEMGEVWKGHTLSKFKRQIHFES